MHSHPPDAATATSTMEADRSADAAGADGLDHPDLASYPLHSVLCPSDTDLPPDRWSIIDQPPQRPPSGDLTRRMVALSVTSERLFSAEFRTEWQRTSTLSRESRLRDVAGCVATFRSVGLLTSTMGLRMAYRCGPQEHFALRLLFATEAGRRRFEHAWMERVAAKATAKNRTTERTRTHAEIEMEPSRTVAAAAAASSSSSFSAHLHQAESPHHSYSYSQSTLVPPIRTLPAGGGAGAPSIACGPFSTGGAVIDRPRALQYCIECGLVQAKVDARYCVRCGHAHTL